MTNTKGNTHKVGDRVTFNGGYPGTVIEVPAWAPGMVTVRGERGSVTIPAEDADAAWVPTDPSEPDCFSPLFEGDAE